LETGANTVNWFKSLCWFNGLMVGEIFHLRSSDSGRIFLRIKRRKAANLLFGLKMFYPSYLQPFEIIKLIQPLLDTGLETGAIESTNIGRRKSPTS
jgi:hypothetical protein